MRVVNLDIVVTDGPTASLEFVGRRLSDPGRIQGLDVVVSEQRTEVSNEFQDGDVVIARSNDFSTGVANGDLGLIVGNDGRMSVEVRDGVAVPVSDRFQRLGILTYHRTQGHALRSIIALVSGTETWRHLRAIVAASTEVTLVGEAAAMAAIVGPLDAGNRPSLEELGRRTLGTDLRVTLNGEAMGGPSPGPR